jgi:cytochrome c oxidase assembly protein subunit 15
MIKLARLAWFTVAWNVVTILLGAVVRATGSGAGCGRSWPTCQGELLPPLEGATAIEFAHRAASGIALALVVWLIILTWRGTSIGHPARRPVLWSGVAVGAEALIGLVIILYEWVADDASLARVVAVPVHLLNTLVLLGLLTLSALVLGGERAPHWDRRSGRWIVLGAVALVLIFASGAVTALADTLFPAQSGEVSTSRHFLTRLRVLHPLLAVFAVASGFVAARVRGLPSVKPAKAVVWLAAAQLVVGPLNIILGVPLWMQVLHLALADGLWISYVWLAVAVLSSSSRSASAVSTGAAQTKLSQT